MNPIDQAAHNRLQPTPAPAILRRRGWSGSQASSIGNELMLAWFKKVIALLVVSAGVVFLWKGLLVLVAYVVVFVAVAYGIDRWSKWRAIRRFRSHWGAQGRDVLLVYSNSPSWQTHVEHSWLPRWGHRAVVLNWSDRRVWERARSPEAQLFRAFSGTREFNPVGIVVPPVGQDVHVVRFWRAFRDRKHGKHDALSKAEAELERLLVATSTPNKPLQPTSGAASPGR